MVPIMDNGYNHERWPQVVSQDVMKHTSSLEGDVLVLSGKVKGKTYLPLPPQEEENAGNAAENSERLVKIM